MSERDQQCDDKVNDQLCCICASWIAADCRTEYEGKPAHEVCKKLRTEHSMRRATPAENLRILRARLSEHLSPAEKRELEQAASILETQATVTLNIQSAGTSIPDEELHSLVYSRIPGPTQLRNAVASAIVQDLKAAAVVFSASRPISMVLFCPNCGAQHIDKPQPEKGWTNPPHRSHECQECGCVWRPADVQTNGVQALQSEGTRDWEAFSRHG